MPKRKMIRLVRTPDGVGVYPTGKKPVEVRIFTSSALVGSRDCVGPWRMPFKTELSTEDRERLGKVYGYLPEEAVSGE
jgi:hypothetical protein